MAKDLADTATCSVRLSIAFGQLAAAAKNLCGSGSAKRAFVGVP